MSTIGKYHLLAHSVIINLMKVILAVSGGIDSMVMLNMIYRSKKYSSHDIILAHFDHGIRENSHQDADFVEKIAAQFGLEFTKQTAKLGAGTSEATARSARYNFLVNLAKQKNAVIFTAHHLDDLIESAAINFLRGTSWRGLAALDGNYDVEIVRPFLEPSYFSNFFSYPPTKSDLYIYSAKHNIHFREDPTNSSDEYLRNRLREQLHNFPLTNKLEIYALWQNQKILKRAIDHEINNIINCAIESQKWSRAWFTELSDNVALELLRAGTRNAGVYATQPQLFDFLHAIRTYAPGKYFNLPDRLIRLEKDFFVL